MTPCVTRTASTDDQPAPPTPRLRGSPDPSRALDTIRTLCDRYHVTYDPTHYAPAFDLPTGWVAGWVGGTPGTLYVGVDPDGAASS